MRTFSVAIFIGIMCLAFSCSDSNKAPTISKDKNAADNKNENGNSNGNNANNNLSVANFIKQAMSEANIAQVNSMYAGCKEDKGTFMTYQKTRVSDYSYSYVSKLYSDSKCSKLVASVSGTMSYKVGRALPNGSEELDIEDRSEYGAYTFYTSAKVDGSELCMMPVDRKDVDAGFAPEKRISYTNRSDASCLTASQLHLGLQ